ncbi:MAG TPA: hypothetical protein VEI02_07990 [Planctomycetota bacterium]|nr:hypothetical protein [Planctomycetota bacterium]
MPERPELSVVVTVVSGVDSVRRTLAALRPGDRTPDGVEILVPIERDRGATAVLAVEYDDVAFVDLGDLPLDTKAPGHLQEHERIDRRRAAGLSVARGDVIAIVEDHGTPAPGFCDAVRAAHRRLPHAAIGGVVANGIPTPINDALWLCDFGRYAPPQDEGPRETLTDVCVSYKREALLRIHDVWIDRYHEPVVHDALRARGETLWLDPKIEVVQTRPPRPWSDRIAERFAWGRLYGDLLGRRLSPFARPFRALVSAFVAPLLLLRLTRLAAGRLPARRLGPALLRATTLLHAWSLGEALGVLFAARD